MFPFKVDVTVKALNQNSAQEMAKELNSIAQNLDLESLKVLAIAAQRPGAKKKIMNYQGMLKRL